MATITFTISDEKLAAFKEGVLKKQPVDIDEETGDPVMSENQWLKEIGKMYYQRLYAQGKRELLATAQEDNIDTEIVT